MLCWPQVYRELIPLSFFFFFQILLIIWSFPCSSDKNLPAVQETQV